MAQGVDLLDNFKEAFPRPAPSFNPPGNPESFIYKKGWEDAVASVYAFLEKQYNIDITTYPHNDVSDDTEQTTAVDEIVRTQLPL